MNKASHVDRLCDQIRELREKARGLPAGDERDELLRKAEQDEIALRLIEWITSSSVKNSFSGWNGPRRGS